MNRRTPKKQQKILAPYTEKRLKSLIHNLAGGMMIVGFPQGCSQGS
jgi:hypothetical protein